MMKLSILPLLVIMLASPVLAVTPDNEPSTEAPAHEAGHHHWDRLWKQLSLTDAQKQQLHEIMQSNRQDMKAAMLKTLTAEKALQEGIAQNPNDEAKLRALSATLESARTEQTIQRARVHAQIAKILTPEQQQQMTQIEQKRSQHLQERIDRLGRSES
jgi:periplasmic protein CpxP/Spy